jgi:polyisoprenoid-binding protein YceI
VKWLGPLAMAAFIIGSCAPKDDKALLSEPPKAALPTPAAPAGPTAAITAAPAPSIEGIPAGEYKIDKPHASLTFRVSHMGYSNFTAQFGSFDAQIQLDPAKPAEAKLTASVDPGSLVLSSPPKGFADKIRGEELIDTKKYPKITYSSTAIEMTGPNTAKVTGNLTLHGITKPVGLDVTFNGGYPGMIQDPHARIGFSAHGVFKRSDFGISLGLPAPGSNMGVGDNIDVALEAEFTGPPLKDNAAPPAKPN